MSLMKQFLLLLFIGTSTMLFAQEEYNLTGGYIADSYDVVSYFKNEKPLKGTKKYQTTFNGAKLKFSSEENLAIFKAHHSKNPISSKTIDKIIIPINDNVASHTISVTINTSLKLTTPKTNAIIAPITAVVPICKFLGCQITKISVSIKIALANIIFYSSSNSTIEGFKV